MRYDIPPVRILILFFKAPFRNTHLQFLWQGEELARHPKHIFRTEAQRQVHQVRKPGRRKDIMQTTTEIRQCLGAGIVVLEGGKVHDGKR